MTESKSTVSSESEKRLLCLGLTEQVKLCWIQTQASVAVTLLEYKMRLFRSQGQTLSIDAFPGVATSEPNKVEQVCEGRTIAGFGTTEKETSCSGFRVVRAGRMAAEA